MLSKEQSSEISSIQEPRYNWPRPAVIRVGPVSSNTGRAFKSQETTQRYLVSKQYWRLLSYIQGLWPSLSNIPRMPHIVVSGISGCGKSWTISACVSFLRQPKLEEMYRALCVSDCLYWMESKDPVSYFCMEMMLALRRDEHEELKMVKSRMVTHFDELRPWLRLIDSWLGKYKLRLIVFLDQTEALLGHSEVGPNLIIQALLEMKNVTLVMSITVDGPSERTSLTNWGFGKLGFFQMHFPFCIPPNDYSYLSDLLFESPLSFHEGAIMREVRYHTGGIIRELTACLTFGCDGVETMSVGKDSNKVKPQVITGVEITTRLEAYRRYTFEKIMSSLEPAILRLDRVQKVALILIIFRMILHLPADAATSSVNLPSEIRSLFLPGAIQKFYHPRDSLAVFLHIPTAINQCAFMVLSSVNVLHMLADKPSEIFHKLIASILDSKTVCSESKRRLVRFYAFHHLTLGNQIKISGVTDFSRSIEVDTGSLFVRYHFAGLTPAKDIIAWLVAQAIFVSESHGRGLTSSKLHRPPSLNDLSHAVPMVFIPGRTDYCFFDYFVFNPHQRKFFAITTAASPPDWQNFTPKSNYSNTYHKGAIVTPASLLEMWSKVLRDVLPVKISTHCVSVLYQDLIMATDCKWKPSSNN